MKKLLALTAFVGTSGALFAQNILVYDDNSVHGYAQTAANNVGTVTVANAGTFDGLLAGGGWDVVVVDCPSTEDTALWTGLETYIAGGGRAVMSFWRWFDRTDLRTAFGATAGSNYSWIGETLYSHSATLFAGVSNPNGDWHDHWAVDGQVFTSFTGVSLGGLSAGGDTVMLLGNSGRTIAMGVIDEAGDTWDADGSAVQLWENSIRMVVVPEPATMATLGLATLALIRRRKKA